MPLCALGFGESKAICKQPREQWHGLCSSSKQPISLLSFSPAVCKAQTRSGSSQHLVAAAKHLSESRFPPSACIAGLSPSLKGNRDFLRFRTHARDQTDCELSAHLE